MGYSISDRKESSLAVTALRSAVARRGNSGADVSGCVVRSDVARFRSRKFLAELYHYDLVGSMGQVVVAA